MLGHYLRLRFGLAFFCAALHGGAVTFGSETVTVIFKSGRKVYARIEPQTDHQQLRLRFGTDRTRVTRIVGWDEISSVRDANGPLSPEDIQQLAQIAGQQKSKAAPARGPYPHYPANGFDAAPRAALGTRDGRRIQTVRFDVSISNWDADVEVDGLVLELWPLSPTGEVMPVSGMLKVELWSMRRVDQDAQPSSAGRSIQRLANWNRPVRVVAGEDLSRLVRLPFENQHPEFDTEWSSIGVVHVELILPGHGVFHHSEDAVRIRPYAPLRDALQRQTGMRFFPTELRGE